MHRVPLLNLLFALLFTATSWAAEPTPADHLAQWRAGAEQGVAADQTALGHAYTQGYGVSQDLAAAARWFEAAAEQGDVDAQTMLGQSYAQGIGVTRDLQAARGWWLKAAEQGGRTAQAKVAFLYALGRGGDKDLVQAYRWFTLASVVAEGEKPGKVDWSGYREDVRSRMSPEQIAEAEALIKGDSATE